MMDGRMDWEVTDPKNQATVIISLAVRILGGHDR